MCDRDVKTVTSSYIVEVYCYYTKTAARKKMPSFFFYLLSSVFRLSFFLFCFYVVLLVSFC